MKRFGRKDLLKFLRALDKHAPKNVKLVIIGGAAAAISFGVAGATIDIDTANSVRGLERACEAARKDTALPVPLSHASAFDAPLQYQSRLERLKLRGLRKLTVLLPEKHDWALMKVVRFEDKDLEHLKAAFRSVDLELKTFEERFLTEMTHVQPRPRLVIHFLAMIEELYGEVEAARLQRVIEGHKEWK